MPKHRQYFTEGKSNQNQQGQPSMQKEIKPTTTKGPATLHPIMQQHIIKQHGLMQMFSQGLNKMMTMFNQMQKSISKLVTSMDRFVKMQ